MTRRSEHGRRLRSFGRRPSLCLVDGTAMIVKSQSQQNPNRIMNRRLTAAANREFMPVIEGVHLFNWLVCFVTISRATIFVSDLPP